MAYSPNLSIIIKAVDKISSRLARDFMELENLQNNHFSATKFANSCYKRIEETLVEDLTKIRSDYNFEFLDGRTIINHRNAEYNFIICPIDGLLNLSRSIPYFTNFVALEHWGKDGKKEIITTVLNNVASNELYFAEKGSGAFLNKRRIRTSKRENNDHIACTLSSLNLANHPLVKALPKTASFKVNSSPSLDVAYLAAGKIDLCILESGDQNFLKSALLLAKEAGAIISEKDGLILVSNGKIRI